MFLSSGYREGTSHRRVSDLFYERKMGESQSDLPASVVFSNSFSLKY